ELTLGEPGERADRPRQRDTRAHERLERAGEGEPLDADRPDLADARRGGRKPGRLEVEDAEARLVERRRRLAGKRDRRTAPGETRVGVDERSEQLSREAVVRRS